MGRKLDLTGLTDNEAKHVLQVVQRDMKLRKKEEQRLSELKQELDEEGSRCLLLSRRSCFNQRCCIRCCLPFTFLLNPKRRCCDCDYNVCKACRVYNKPDKGWLCSACQKSRLWKTQSLEWFYTNVKTRFKRFGSAKVLKTLYRKHLAEHSTLSELTESSTYEDSICNEGSFCGSDSTFYRQTQEHSVAETITVALRVAEEAIDEAISKAEFDTASQEKQNEAHYLREHRGELIEELSKTIVQKIISRRKTLNELRAEYDQDWLLEHNTDLPHPSDCDQASSSLKPQPDLWSSHTAFSLLDNVPPGLIQDSSQALNKDGDGSTMSTWKSVDRLDTAGVYGAVSSVLKSPDGNWIALQSAPLSRPSLLTRRKSQIFSALERESEVVSAYEGLGSDNETKSEPDARVKIPSLPTGSRDDLFSDSEGYRKPNKPPLALCKRKMPAEIEHPPSSCRTSIIDVNFNVDEASEEEQSKVAAKPDLGKVRRLRKKRRSKKDLSSSVLDCREKGNHSPHPSDTATLGTLTSGATTPEPSHLESDITGDGDNQMEQELTVKLQQLAGRLSEGEVDGEARGAGNDGQREEKRRGGEDRDEDRGEDRDEDDQRLWRTKVDLDEERTNEDKETDEEMKYRLYRLIAQSRLTYLTTDDDLDKASQSEGEWDGDENEDTEAEKTDGLASRLCQLESEVGVNQFSSTEDELDRVGIVDDGRKTATGEEEELAVKVCRLADEANATQFSSTEDELDRAGRSGEVEDVMDEEKLWKLQADRDVQAAQLCNLASLLSASQFSSTEDELDRVGENEAEVEIIHGGTEREKAAGKNRERRESFGDLDEKMFDLRDETEEMKMESSDEKVCDVQDKTEVEGKKECMEEKVMDKDEHMVKGHMCEEKVELLKEDKAKEMEERQAMEFESAVQAERTEETMSLHKTKVQKEFPPEAKWPVGEEGEDIHEEVKIRESKESQDSAADSEEEDAEFDRIISSMLMMTLEDMQAEALNNDAAENGSLNREPEEGETGENVEVQRGSAFDENSVDSPEAGTEFQSRCDDVTPEEDVSELIGGDAAGRHENKQQEKNANAKETSETEGTRTHGRGEADDDKREDRRVPTEWEMMATRGYAADGDGEGLEETKEDVEESVQEDYLLSPEEIQNSSDTELYKTIQFISALLEQRYSAVSLRSITTEVLKVLNATEELLLLQGAEGGDHLPISRISLPPNTDPKKLEQQFSRLEENVYVAAGEAYNLEAELSDLEECARGVCSTTSDMELSFLEEQVASAAAKVQQSDLQVCDISARIAALKSAGLNVDTQQSRFTKTIPVTSDTVDSSRQSRRRLPAPPVRDCLLEDEDEL